MKVAIIGSGNIGCDILAKTLLSHYLKCKIFVGRNPSSRGLEYAKKFKVNVSADGIAAILKDPSQYDLLFDATSAQSHREHIALLQGYSLKLINLTPEAGGYCCIPCINIKKTLYANNISLVTCGAQASIPLAYAIYQVHKNIEYIEVVNTISSKSAGAATRYNIDEYLNATESALIKFTKCHSTKSILNINPGIPETVMRTTIYAKIKNPCLEKITNSINNMVTKIKKYVPGYELIGNPIIKENCLVVILSVKGLGHYLPEYAGNLDIITSAAVNIAEFIAKRSQKYKVKNDIL